MSENNTLMTETSTLAQLVVAAQSGDRDAQAALYQRYQSSTIALAYRQLGNWDEAEELAQDVFIHAFERLGQLRVAEAFGGWLRQIVRRMAINRATRRRLAFNLEPESLDFADACENSPLDNVLDIEQRQQVQDGLSRLGQLDRATLEAFYMGGQSLIEMADLFDAPIGTIKRRLHVARKRLAREMEELQTV